MRGSRVFSNPVTYVYCICIGKEPFELGAHPKRDKLLEILPEMHSDVVVSQNVHMLFVKCVSMPVDLLHTHIYIYIYICLYLLVCAIVLCVHVYVACIFVYICVHVFVCGSQSI